MATYNVLIPIAGYASVEVEASSEKEAIKKAMDEVTLDDIQEWSGYEQIVQGNVLYAPQNDVEVELIDEDED